MLSEVTEKYQPFKEMRYEYWLSNDGTALWEPCSLKKKSWIKTQLDFFLRFLSTLNGSAAPNVADSHTPSQCSPPPRTPLCLFDRRSLSSSFYLLCSVPLSLSSCSLYFFFFLSFFLCLLASPSSATPLPLLCKVLLALIIYPLASIIYIPVVRCYWSTLSIITIKINNLSGKQ